MKGVNSCTQSGDSAVIIKIHNGTVPLWDLEQLPCFDKVGFSFFLNIFCGAPSYLGQFFCSKGASKSTEESRFRLVFNISEKCWWSHKSHQHWRPWSWQLKPVKNRIMQSIQSDGCLNPLSRVWDEFKFGESKNWPALRRFQWRVGNNSITSFWKDKDDRTITRRVFVSVFLNLLFQFCRQIGDCEWSGAGCEARGQKQIWNQMNTWDARPVCHALIISGPLCAETSVISFSYQIYERPVPSPPGTVSPGMLSKCPNKINLVRCADGGMKGGLMIVAELHKCCKATQCNFKCFPKDVSVDLARSCHHYLSQRRQSASHTVVQVIIFQMFSIMKGIENDRQSQLDLEKSVRAFWCHFKTWLPQGHASLRDVRDSQHWSCHGVLLQVQHWITAHYSVRQE